MVSDPVQGLLAKIETLQDNVGTPGPVVVPLGNEDVEGILAGVSAWPVTAVMSKSDRLGQGDVDADSAGDRRRDLGHLEGVRQPGALVIGRKDHDLGLAGESAEGCGMHNPIAVPFEAGALVVRLLRNRPIACSLGERRARAKRGTLSLLPQLAAHERSGTEGGVRPRM